MSSTAFGVRAGSCGLYIGSSMSAPQYNLTRPPCLSTDARQCRSARSVDEFERRVPPTPTTNGPMLCVMTYLLYCDWIDRRTHSTNYSQGRGDELEFVDTVGRTVFGQRGEVPVFAEHQPHIPQAEHVHRQKRSLDPRQRVFDHKVIGGDSSDVVIVKPSSATPVQS